jgi:two-component system, cell cycle response regulator DivK
MAGELILIVEDNERNRKLVRDVLRFKGYQTIEVETGEESLRLARDHRPSLILMDIQLPGIDGIEALKRLRADPGTRAIPVMAMTASIMTAGPEEMRAAGFDGYQSKPLQVKEFLAAVEQLLEKPT